MYKLNKKLYSLRYFAAARIASFILMVGAAAALVALVYFQVRPFDPIYIKVPVSTDKTEYFPGQDVSGLFFGEVYYSGETRITRKIICPHFRADIPDPNTGKRVVDTVNRPHKLDGVAAYIGKIPSDSPVGEQCIIEFNNHYDIRTPFGSRPYDYTYYTYGFAIIASAAPVQSQPTVGQSSDSTSFENTGTGNAHEQATTEQPIEGTPDYQNFQNNSGQDSAPDNRLKVGGIPVCLPFTEVCVRQP